MRVVVLFFGIIAVFLTALTGVMFLMAPDFLTTLYGFENPALTLFADILVDYKFSAFAFEDAGIFLLGATLYGILGIILVTARCGWQGGLLMIVPIIITTIMHPASIAFTGLQVLAGLMACLVFPLPINAPSAADEDDDEDEKLKAKPKPKGKPAKDDEDEEAEVAKTTVKSKTKAKVKAMDEDEEVEAEEEEIKVKTKKVMKSKRKDDDDD